MLLDPTDRFLLKKGKLEGKLEMARKLIDDGHPIDYVVELSGLSEKEILNAK
jgi:hypothetical protein